MEDGHMFGMGAFGLFVAVIYLGVLIFFLWAILSAVKSLSQIAQGQRETGEALKEIARKLGER